VLFLASNKQCQSTHSNDAENAQKDAETHDYPPSHNALLVPFGWYPLAIPQRIRGLVHTGLQLLKPLSPYIIPMKDYTVAEN